jgi:hypothetical protein
MRRLSLYATVLALFAGTAAMLQHDRANPSPAMQNEAGLNNNAAFRDGLYLGRLAAKSGDQGRVAIGRWAAESDRALFKTGFQRGYDEFLASRRPPDVAVRRAE